MINNWNSDIKLDIQRQLLDALFTNSGEQTIIETASRILENPIVLCSARLKRVIASSPSNIYAENSAWQKIIESIDCDSPAVKDFEREDIQNTLFGQGEVISKIIHDPVTCMFSKVLINDILLAVVAVLPGKTEINDDILWLGDFLSKIFSQEIQKSSYLQTVYETADKSFLEDALNENFADEESAAAKLISTGWRSKGSYHLFTIDKRSKDEPLETKALTSFITNLFPGGIHLIYKGKFVFMYTITADEELSQNLLNELSAFLDKNGMIAQVSPKFFMFIHAAEGFRQNVLGLELMRKMNEKRAIINTDDYYPYILIDICKEPKNLLSFLSPTAHLIKQYDKKNNTSLYSTMLCYIKNGKNHAKTQQELFIHRNTLSYRLKLIKQISGIDFDNGIHIMRLLINDYANDYWSKINA